MADVVPLLQTVLWVALIACVLIFWRKTWSGILSGVRERVERGDPLTIASFSLGSKSEFDRLAQGSPRLIPSRQNSATLASIDEDELEMLRHRMGEDQRGVHLVHVATPTEKQGQTHDLFVYLAGWGRDRFGMPNDLSDIRSAEFHVGPKFSPDGVTVVPTSGGGIGFSTSAYAPVLCVCRVTFADGHRAILQRYLDFEAAKLAERAFQVSP